MLRVTALTLMAAGFTCAPQDRIANVLGGKHGERVVTTETRDGWTLDRWENGKTQTWTVTATDEMGLSCVMADGKFEVT